MEGIPIFVNLIERLFDMPYNGQQLFLCRAADKYIQQGYEVGLTKNKELLCEYDPIIHSIDILNKNAKCLDFSGISIIPNGIVCVDFDIPDFGLIREHLPSTWKEKTPRGWHLYYRFPLGSEIMNSGSPKIKWRPHVDLLIKTRKSVSKSVIYANGKTEDKNSKVWGEHVVCSPTNGYILVYSDHVPIKDKLTIAPDWLVDALLQ